MPERFLYSLQMRATQHECSMILWVLPSASGRARKTMVAEHVQTSTNPYHAGKRLPRQLDPRPRANHCNKIVLSTCLSIKEHRIANFSSKWFAPNWNIIHYINILAKFLHEDRFPPENRHKMSSFMQVGSRTHVNSRGCREGMHNNGLSMFMKIGSCGSVCKWGIPPKLPFNGKDVWLSQFGVYHGIPRILGQTRAAVTVFQVHISVFKHWRSQLTALATDTDQTHHKPLASPARTTMRCWMFVASFLQRAPLKRLSLPALLSNGPWQCCPLHWWGTSGLSTPGSPQGQSTQHSALQKSMSSMSCPDHYLAHLSTLSTFHISQNIVKYRIITIFNNDFDQACWYTTKTIHRRSSGHNCSCDYSKNRQHRPVLPGDRKADGPAAGDGSDRVVL